jgi:hypothetical protein
MAGRMHTAQEFYEFMAPMGPVRCEQLFLRDPRFPAPLVGTGSRLWLTAPSIKATTRILREGWPEQPAAPPAPRKRTAQAPEPPKRRGRPPKTEATATATA